MRNRVWYIIQEIPLSIVLEGSQPALCDALENGAGRDEEAKGSDDWLGMLALANQITMLKLRGQAAVPAKATMKAKPTPRQPLSRAIEAKPIKAKRRQRPVVKSPHISKFELSSNSSSADIDIICD